MRRSTALQEVSQHLAHVEVRAHPGKPDLAGLLCGALEVQQLVGHFFRSIPVVQVPDIEIVRAELAQAGVQLILSLLPRPSHALAGKNDLLPLALMAAPTMRSLFPF